MSKAETKTMTREEILLAEHKLQTGESDKLLDGRTIAEAQADNLKLQKKQDEELRERGVQDVKDYPLEHGLPKTGEDFLSEKLDVAVTKTGVTIARPQPAEVAEPEETGKTLNPSPVENALEPETETKTVPAVKK